MHGIVQRNSRVVWRGAAPAPAGTGPSGGHCRARGAVPPDEQTNADRIDRRRQKRVVHATDLRLRRLVDRGGARTKPAGAAPFGQGTRVCRRFTAICRQSAAVARTALRPAPSAARRRASKIRRASKRPGPAPAAAQGPGPSRARSRPFASRASAVRRIGHGRDIRVSMGSTQ